MGRLLVFKSALGLVLAFVLVASAMSASAAKKVAPPSEPFKAYMEDDTEDLSDDEREQEEKFYLDRLLTDRGLFEEYFPRLERIDFDDLETAEDEFEARDRIREEALARQAGTKATAPATEETTAPVTEGTTVSQGERGPATAPAAEDTTVPQKRKSSTAGPAAKDIPVPQEEGGSTATPVTEKGPVTAPVTGKSTSSLFGFIKNKLSARGKTGSNLPSVPSKDVRTGEPARAAEKETKGAPVVPTEGPTTQEGSSVAPEEASLDEVWSLESDTEGDKPGKDTIKESAKPRTDASSGKSKPRFTLRPKELTEEEALDEDYLLEILKRAIAREGKKKSKVTEPTKTEKPAESLPSQLVETVASPPAKKSSQVEVDLDSDEEVEHGYGYGDIHEREEGEEEEEDEEGEEEDEEDELP